MTQIDHQRDPCAPLNDVAVTPEVLVVTRLTTGADLAPQVASLQAQSLRTWQWAIVCSPHLREALHPLPTDPRVCLLEEESAAGDTAVRVVRDSTCPFVCNLSIGAVIAPTFLEKAAWVLGANAYLSCCNAQATGEDGSVWPYGFEQGERFLEMNFAGATALFRREDVMATGLSLPADDDESWEFWLRLAERGRWGYTIREPLIRYQRHLSNTPFRSDDPSRYTAQRDRLRARYGALRGRFPPARLPDAQPFEAIDCAQFLSNSRRVRADAQNVLIIMPWFVVGGAERVNLNLVEYLKRRSIEVSVVATLRNQKHPWIAEFERFTPDVFVLDHFLRLPDVPRFLVHLIRSRNIDTAILSNSYLGYQLLPYLRAHCPDTVFVDFIHSYNDDWKNGGYPRASVGYQTQIDLTIVTGAHVKRWMEARGADPKRIEVCYTNVDTDYWRPNAERRARTRSILGLADDDMLIVMIGRLAREKRPHLFAPIMAALQRRTRSRFMALVLGDGAERGQVDRQIRELRLNDVMRTLGRIGDDEIFDYLAAADVFLIPSQTEGVSVATMEAMAMGVTPVSADVGGQGELITPDCGFLVPHGRHEIDEYADVLARLADNPELRQKMSAAARERVERHFALRDFGPRMEMLMERARAYHRDNPRPAIPLELAHEWATQIIEYTRQEMVLDELWAEWESWRSNPRPHPSLAQPPRQSTRRRILRFAWAQLAHVYRWGVANGMEWLVPLKERLVSEARRRGW
jgi:glycosyltransferase involved in cell wall biosynthesis